MIYTPVDIHLVADATAYRALVEATMAYRRANGYPDAAVTENSDTVIAYINASRWMVDCICSSPGSSAPPANSVHPDWSLACCLHCGRCRVNIVIPADRADIEAALNLRPLEETRNWKPPDTLADLLADNTAHGL